MDIKKNFGKNVRMYRKEKWYSQEKLWQLCKLHRTYIGIVERWEKNISLENIQKIAKALCIKEKVLFEF